MNWPLPDPGNGRPPRELEANQGTPAMTSTTTSHLNSRRRHDDVAASSLRPEPVPADHSDRARFTLILSLSNLILRLAPCAPVPNCQRKASAMTTCNSLSRRLLTDLSSNYLSFLEEIDEENQERHLHGEPLAPYPSFDEFLDLCREESFDPEAEANAYVHEFDTLHRVLDAEFFDEADLNWIVAMPAFGIACDDEENADPGMSEESVWVTSHGSFAFVSSSKH